MLGYYYVSARKLPDINTAQEPLFKMRAVTFVGARAPTRHVGPHPPSPPQTTAHPAQTLKPKILKLNPKP